MTEADLEQAAVRLREAYRGGPIDPLATWLEFADERVGYRIQDINTRHWVAAGRRIAGCKIGLTSEAVQRQLGVDQPDYGVLFEDMEVVSGEAVPVDRLLQPRAEAEVAFVLADDVTDPDISPERLSRAIAWAIPAIEVADSRVRDWKITLADTIADNASAGVYVLGAERWPLGEQDLACSAMTLAKNGATVSSGTGAACLGHPLNAVLWLARKMIDHGRPLAAGDVVLSGALGPMTPVTSGDELRAEIGGLGCVEVSFR